MHFSESFHSFSVEIIYISVVSLEKQPPEVFYKKDVLKNFANFTEKHLWCKSLFTKVAGMRPATLLKRDFNTDVFQ